VKYITKNPGVEIVPGFSFINPKFGKTGSEKGEPDHRHLQIFRLVVFPAFSIHNIHAR